MKALSSKGGVPFSLTSPRHNTKQIQLGHGRRQDVAIDPLLHRDNLPPSTNTHRHPPQQEHIKHIPLTHCSGSRPPSPVGAGLGTASAIAGASEAARARPPASARPRCTGSRRQWRSCAGSLPAPPRRSLGGRQSRATARARRAQTRGTAAESAGRRRARRARAPWQGGGRARTQSARRVRATRCCHRSATRRAPLRGTYGCSRHQSSGQTRRRPASAASRAAAAGPSSQPARGWRGGESRSTRRGRECRCRARARAASRGRPPPRRRGGGGRSGRGGGLTRPSA
mmetsp:Transcript_21181/g.67671  ORF Transcript_21181/g.67671 Transcript_21181/m.67671 type:complete len:285 (-) Transcript_21181:1259-2113(-)